MPFDLDTADRRKPEATPRERLLRLLRLLPGLTTDQVASLVHQAREGRR